MSETWILYSIRHRQLIKTECDSLREAVLTAWHEVQWNVSSPVRIVCPDGSVIVRDERPVRSNRPFTEGTIDALMQKFRDEPSDD